MNEGDFSQDQNQICDGGLTGIGMPEKTGNFDIASNLART